MYLSSTLLLILSNTDNSWVMTVHLVTFWSYVIIPPSVYDKLPKLQMLQHHSSHPLLRMTIEALQHSPYPLPLAPHNYFSPPILPCRLTLQSSDSSLPQFLWGRREQDDFAPSVQSACKCFSCWEWNDLETMILHNFRHPFVFAENWCLKSCKFISVLAWKAFASWSDARSKIVLLLESRWLTNAFHAGNESSGSHDLAQLQVLIRFAENGCLKSC